MILRRLRPLIAVGRWTAAQTTRFGASLGSVGYVAVGPVCVLVALPRRLQVADPTLFDLNAHLRRVHARRATATQD